MREKRLNLFWWQVQPVLLTFAPLCSEAADRELMSELGDEAAVMSMTLQAVAEAESAIRKLAADGGCLIIRNVHHAEQWLSQGLPHLLNTMLLTSRSHTPDAPTEPDAASEAALAEGAPPEPALVRQLTEGTVKKALLILTMPSSFSFKLNKHHRMRETEEQFAHRSLWSFDAIKRVVAPPLDSSDILRASMSQVDGEYQAIKADCSERLRSLLIGAAVLHACLAARLVTIGKHSWELPYDFSERELSSMVQLCIEIELKGDALDMPQLRFMIGELGYVGLMADEWDRNLVHSYLQAVFSSELPDGGLVGRKLPSSDKSFAEIAEQLVEPEDPTDGVFKGLME